MIKSMYLDYVNKYTREGRPFYNSLPGAKLSSYATDIKALLQNGVLREFPIINESVFVSQAQNCYAFYFVTFDSDGFY